MKGFQGGLVLTLVHSKVYGLAPSWSSSQSIAHRHWRGPYVLPRRATRRTSGEIGTPGDKSSSSTSSAESDLGNASDPSALGNVQKVTLYEEFSKYADKSTVAQEVIFEITSKEHFDDVVSRAAGANEACAEGYEDAQGNWRIPHKILMIEIHAGWCRVCKGLQPKLLKLVTKHPEVICCKINKTNHEDLAAKLGVRGLPMIIFFKRGQRIDHFTTANINTIEEAIRDNS